MDIPSSSVSQVDSLTDDLQSLTLNTSKGKQKDDTAQTQTTTTTKLPDDVVVVDTELTFRNAILELEQYPTWIVDCEGFNLGSAGGELSILSIRGVSSATLPPKTFLIDIVLLTRARGGGGGDDGENPEPQSYSLLRPLFDLLESPSITKVFWDGRMDFCAIYFGYGVELNTVVDLQVVEMRRRISEENFQKQLQRLMRFFAPRELSNPRRNGKYAHLHILQGLGGCLIENKVEVKTPKGSVDHNSWMIRPLSDIHLFYAANDVYLIGLLLLHYEKRGLIDDAILMPSQRYITIWKDQQPEEDDVFRSNPFFALEILEYDPSSDRQRCSGCRRYLSQVSFPDESWNMEGPGKRCCHICSVIPTWQQREKFFADLKAKKKEKQERKRIEEERKKRVRTETGSRVNTSTVSASEERVEQPGVHRNQRGNNRGRWTRGRARAAHSTSGVVRETGGVGEDTPRGSRGQRPTRSIVRAPRGRAVISRGSGARHSGDSMFPLAENGESAPGGSAAIVATAPGPIFVRGRGRVSDGLVRGRGGGRARRRVEQAVPSGSMVGTAAESQSAVVSSRGRGRGSTGGIARGRAASRSRGRGSVSS